MAWPESRVVVEQVNIVVSSTHTVPTVVVGKVNLLIELIHLFVLLSI